MNKIYKTLTKEIKEQLRNQCVFHADRQEDPTAKISILLELIYRFNTTQSYSLWEAGKDFGTVIIIIKENKIRGQTLFYLKIYYKNTVISTYSVHPYNTSTWGARVGRSAWAIQGDQPGVCRETLPQKDK